MGTYNVVILSAHLHKYSVLSRKTAGGGFVQIAVSSVMPNRANKIKDERTTKDYGPDLVNAEPRFDPSSLERRKGRVSRTQLQNADIPAA